LTYNFNLLVSHEWSNYSLAKQEILRLLAEFGDNDPKIGRTIAKGLSGVNTTLESRGVIASLKQKFASDKLAVNFTLRWTPVDLWCDAGTVESMKQALSTLANKILPGEKWMMHVEKRRYAAHHKAELIKELADLIHEKVDLKNPDKIVWIEIVGKQAGISIITPSEIFSLHKSVTNA
jgi:tRNA acetyltransferase TAN1